MFSLVSSHPASQFYELTMCRSRSSRSALSNHQKERRRFESCSPHRFNGYATRVSSPSSLLNETFTAASWTGLTGASLYSASKHAVLGFMRSMTQPLEARGIRIAVIHPWFSGKHPTLEGPPQSAH